MPRARLRFPSSTSSPFLVYRSRINSSTVDSSKAAAKSSHWHYSTAATLSPPEPTIFAPATARGKAAISILRISGPEVLKVWHQCTSPPHAEKRSRTAMATPGPPERKAMLRKIVHPQTKEVLDEAIVLYFPAHSALTAQPTLELHTHGSPALLQLLLNILPTLSKSFRIAEPGEFTRLAFEAGKMDLTQVEGIRDLVDANTESQRSLAARQANGRTRMIYEGMRANIIESMALIEALIDFGEDEGISEDVFEQARSKVVDLRDRIAQSLADGRRGEIIRSGIQLAIIGAPNAGKSSLLNWLAQREAAIVAASPGTTRDIVELNLDYHGFPITIADTAGLRKTQDEVEGIGIARAMIKAREADIKLCVLSLPAIFSGSNDARIDPLTLGLIDASTIIVLNKLDALSPTDEQLKSVRNALLKTTWDGTRTKAFFPISVKNGLGLKQLGEGLRETLKERFDLPEDLDDVPLVTHARHRRHLEDCHSSLSTFLSLKADDIVSAAEELRFAVFALGKISGAVDTEEILGEIFSGFCIGK